MAGRVVVAVAPLVVKYVGDYLKERKKKGQKVHVEQESLPKEVERELMKIPPSILQRILEDVEDLRLQGLNTKEIIRHLVSAYPVFADAIVSIVSKVTGQSHQKQDSEGIAELQKTLEDAMRDENNAIMFYTNLMSLIRRNAKDIERLTGLSVDAVIKDIRSIVVDEMKHYEVLYDLRTRVGL